MPRRSLAVLTAALVLTTAIGSVLAMGAPRSPEPASTPAADAGASSSPATTTDGGASTSSDGMAWELLDCQFAVAFVPADTDELQELVPPGFTVRSIPTRYVGQAPGLTTLVGIESEICDRGTGLPEDGYIDGMVYASVWVGVIPPEDLQVESFEGGYYVNFDPLIPDDDRRQAFVDAGVPAHGGEVEISPLVEPTGPNTRVSAYTLDGLGDLRVHALAPEDPLSVFSGSFIQWTEATDGDLARWQVDWAMETFHQGPGTVEVPEGSWLSDLFGSDTVPAPLVYTGTWDYTDGEIVLPS